MKEGGEASATKEEEEGARAEKATALAETEKGSEQESKARPAFALQAMGEEESHPRTGTPDHRSLQRARNREKNKGKS